MAVDFSHYYYYPCLQCSEPEQIAYRELADDDKDAILPIIELSQIKNEASFFETIQSVKSLLLDRPFILDLSKDRAPAAFIPKQNPDHAKIKKLQDAHDNYNSQLVALLSPIDGFAAWRACVSEFPHAIPVLQFTDPATQGKSILRQAAQFWKAGYTRLAIRVNQECGDDIYPVIGQIISFLDSADQLIVLVDCGQGRTHIPDRAEFAKKAVARVSEELDSSQVLSLSAVCISDTFPGQTETKVYDSYSWELWREASTSFPFLYGDYAANRRIKKQSTYMPGEWKAQVVYPLPESWIVYRHANTQDAQGWVEGSRAITAHSHFDDGVSCWGEKILKFAVTGQLDPYASARFWHGAKINMHINRQIRYARDVAISGFEF